LAGLQCFDTIGHRLPESGHYISTKINHHQGGPRVILQF